MHYPQCCTDTRKAISDAMASLSSMAEKVFNNPVAFAFTTATVTTALTFMYLAKNEKNPFDYLPVFTGNPPDWSMF